MWGLGKKRSKVGKFIDKEGYYQQDLVRASGLDKGTVSRICNDPEYEPTMKTIKKIMKALRKIDPNVKTNDFFDI